MPSCRKPLRILGVRYPRCGQAQALSLHGCKQPIRGIFRLRKRVHDDRLDAMTADDFERVIEDELDGLRGVSLPSELGVYDETNVEVVHSYGVVSRLGRHGEVDHPDNVFSCMV